MNNRPLLRNTRPLFRNNARLLAEPSGRAERLANNAGLSARPRRRVCMAFSRRSTNLLEKRKPLVLNQRLCLFFYQGDYFVDYFVKIFLPLTTFIPFFPVVAFMPYFSTTVQPSGMPLVPLGHSTPLALVKVPVDKTLASHPVVQSSAEMSVARQVMLLRFVQPANIPS